MKVCLLTTGELFGGLERQNLALMGALKPRGAELELIAFHDGVLAERTRALGVPVHILSRRRALDFDCVRELRQLLAQRPHSVISVHGYVGAMYLALAIGKKSHSVKTEHGFAEGQFVPLRERIKPWLYRTAETWATRRARALVVYVTRDLQRRCVREHAGLEGRVIYNGIDPLDRAACLRPPEYARHALNYALVGRVEPVKGIEYAIRAMANSAVPSGAHLHVIGTGPLLVGLEQLADAIKVRQRVSFHGFRANSYDYIAHADALLMPSLHEGLPYTALEAMSLRTPLVVSSVGGMKEVLRHGETALLVPPRDTPALAAALARLASDPDLASRLREAGAQKVGNHFSALAMAKAYEDAFRHVLAT